MADRPNKNSNENHCGSLLKVFIECLEKQRGVGCSVELKQYLRCEQQTLLLKWHSTHPKEENQKKKRVSFRHFDNFGTIVNEPTDLKDKEHVQEDGNSEPPSSQKETKTSKQHKTTNSVSYQQRWGTYEPVNSSFPLIDFWKSYWKNSRRMIDFMVHGKHLENSQKFGKKIYKRMERQLNSFYNTFRTLFDRIMSHNNRKNSE